MRLRKCVYICIYSVYEFWKFFIYTCIYDTYNDLLIPLVFLVNVCLLLKNLSLFVYMTYTLLAYILYIYNCI